MPRKKTLVEKFVEKVSKPKKVDTAQKNSTKKERMAKAKGYAK